MNIHHDIHFHVLIIDRDSTLKINQHSTSNISCYNKEEVAISHLGKQIVNKYHSKPDKLRWSLKPIFLRYLIAEKKCEQIIYTDNDIAFFDDYAFLFELLEKHPVLLTPHRYPRNPYDNQKWLEVNFTIGLYNAGFFACNHQAFEILNWWASCCLYRCERNPWRGLFDDQKYLDLVPIIEPNTLILRHEGCNIADWNREICKRVIVNDKVLINEKYPVVFIHFNSTTLRAIYEGKDSLLLPFFEKYTGMLKKYKPDLNWDYVIKPTSFKEIWQHKIWRFLNYLNNTSSMQEEKEKQ